jgi:hypothetical protein
MLRALFVLLLLANLAFYAWTQGWLDGVIGVRAHAEREPERLARQVRPELIRVLTPQAVAAAASAAESRLQCLEAGPFGSSEANTAEAALASVLPSGTWARVTRDKPAVWIVYMGKYGSEALARKQEELTRIKVPFEVLKGAPEWEPGLALGRFDNHDAADEALAQLGRRGIHTARLVELSKPSTQTLLRVERADPELAGKVSGLKLDALGKGFAACAKQP